MNTTQLIEHVAESVRKAWLHESRLPEGTLEIGGKTSPKIRHLLNNLCSLPGNAFLEVGSWKGASFISALAGNEGTVESGMAIDAWCQYGTPIDAYSEPEQEFDINTGTWLGGHLWYKLKQDLFATTELPALPNIFYYDGPHDRTEAGVSQFFPLIADPCIVALDGWGLASDMGSQFVQQGWEQALEKSPWRVIEEWELPSERYKDTDLWWEGFYVCVLQKEVT